MPIVGCNSSIKLNIFLIVLKGLAFRQYDNVFQDNHRLTMTILKEFGFGSKNFMEVRILEELEFFISKVKEFGNGSVLLDRIIHR